MTIKSDVVAALKTVLEGIDGTGSFHYDLKVVDDAAPTANDKALWPRASIRSLRERYSEVGVAFLDRLFTAEIEAWVRVDAPVETIQQAQSLILADLERAIMADVRLGLAPSVIGATLDENETFGTAGKDQSAGLFLRITIHYRTALTDPNT